jgi:hypothetical protein
MKRFRFLPVVVLGLTLALPAFAQDKWVTTGSSLRVKSIGPFTAKVYTITHLMKGRPTERSKRGIIDAEVDKQFQLFFQRDVDAEKIKGAFKEGFEKNGYTDQAKIARFIGAVGTGDVVEYNAKTMKGQPSISIAYSADSKTTTINVPGHGSAKVEGSDFMKATWSIWYGRIDQPSMGDQLMVSLPKD